MLGVSSAVTCMCCHLPLLSSFVLLSCMTVWSVNFFYFQISNFRVNSPLAQHTDYRDSTDDKRHSSNRPGKHTVRATNLHSTFQRQQIRDTFIISQIAHRKNKQHSFIIYKFVFLNWEFDIAINDNNAVSEITGLRILLEHAISTMIYQWMPSCVWFTIFPFGHPDNVEVLLHPPHIIVADTVDSMTVVCHTESDGAVYCIVWYGSNYKVLSVVFQQSPCDGIQRFLWSLEKLK